MNAVLPVIIKALCMTGRHECVSWRCSHAREVPHIMTYYVNLKSFNLRVHWYFFASISSITLCIFEFYRSIQMMVDEGRPSLLSRVLFSHHEMFEYLIFSQGESETCNIATYMPKAYARSKQIQFCAHMCIPP